MIAHPKPPSVRFNNGTANRQPQSQSVGFRGPKWFKHLLRLLKSEPGTTIRHTRVDKALARIMRFDRKLPGWRRFRDHRIRRIDNEVHQYLLQPYAVAVHKGQTR